MLRLQSSGGLKRRIVPVFVCDVCEQPISNLGVGAAVFRNHGVGEDELLNLLHVHKGICHDQADAKFAGESRAPWVELADHLNEVASGMGFTIRGMIGREVAWSCALNPTQHEELQKRVSELRDWLCRHGVHSPLWCEDHGEDA